MANYFIITENHREIGSIKINWSRNSTIVLKATTHKDLEYYLSQESMWRSKFVIKSRKSEILKIHAQSNLRKLHPDYLLSIENAKEIENLNLLIAISIYLINNRLKSAAAGASIAAVS